MVNREYFFPWKPVFKPLEEEIDLGDMSENIEINELTHSKMIDDDFIAASPQNYIFKSHGSSWAKSKNKWILNQKTATSNLKMYTTMDQTKMYSPNNPKPKPKSSW